ncbi:MAG: alcohol dehydrogenase catalytic domain-containing protein [Acidimicrobiales bacterium]|jgi:threonine dehydrogenase-like Zn-dependent dehydrogenase|nr:alcohol dehydrogenase catalytic domain-containing protein [Acidimicrobiales bacterium]
MGEIPTTMSSAVYVRPGEVAVEQRPVPRPAEGQVLVEVGHCGICGSDIHMILEGWGTAGRVEGHEWTGVVASVGPGVDGWVPGDEVVGGPSPRCGSCRRCREGRPSQCENRGRSMSEGPALDGGFADYVLVDHRQLLRVPPGLSRRAAALAEPMAVALHGITRGEIGPEDSVMVMGAGPIGALSVAALVAEGLGPVTVVEPGERRRELAIALGADRVRHPDDLEVFPQWEPDRIADDAVHVVLECSGKRAAMEAGFCQLARGGRLVMVGAGIEAPTFDPNRMLLNELSVCGSFVYDEGGFEAALALLASDGFPLDLLLEPDDAPLDRLVDTMTALARGDLAAKAMVVPPRAARRLGAPR